MQFTIGMKVVIFPPDHSLQPPQVGRVGRITPSGRVVVLLDGRRFVASNGYEYGEPGYKRKRIEPFREEFAT